MCTSHFGAVVRTTHVTGTTHDIGSTLGRMTMILMRKHCRCARLNVLERAEIRVDLDKLLVLGPMWLSFLLGCFLGSYLGDALGIYALLVPGGYTTVVGMTYTIFRQRLKEFFKSQAQARLACEVVEIEETLQRTRNSLHVLRRSGSTKSLGEEMDFDLEAEVEHILDTLHDVEDDMEELQSHADKERGQSGRL